MNNSSLQVAFHQVFVKATEKLFGCFFWKGREVYGLCEESFLYLLLVLNPLAFRGDEEWTKWKYKCLPVSSRMGPTVPWCENVAGGLLQSAFIWLVVCCF